MRRALLSALGATLMAAMFVGSASAAQPTIIRFSADDPAEEASWSEFVSDICGFPISVDREGRYAWMFMASGRMIEVDPYTVRSTFSANGRSVMLVEGGLEAYWYNNEGHLLVAITGRQATYYGFAGRVVLDTVTREVSFSGLDLGWLTNQVCEPLAP